MVPILINKDVFEHSYNDLKFMAWNHNYFCSNLIIATLTIWETLQCPKSRYKQNPDSFLFFALMLFLDINIFFFSSWLIKTRCSNTNHYSQEVFSDTLSLYQAQMRCSYVLSLLTCTVLIMLYCNVSLGVFPVALNSFPLGTVDRFFFLIVVNIRPDKLLTDAQGAVRKS